MVISIRNLSFLYQNRDRHALNDVSLEIGKGEIAAIAGPSGCGKSTLLRCVNGLIPHMYTGTYQGSVFVEGHEVVKTPIRELAKNVGFVFQNPENQLFMFSVEREVAFSLENMGYPRDEIRRRVDWALKLLGISHLATSSPNELSDGQKQRLALASVLALKPGIIVLDEPTSLLDPKTAFGLVQAIRQVSHELGLTVLIVEQRLELVAPIAFRLIVMHEGRIVLNGPPGEVLSKEEVCLVGVGVPATIRLQTLLGSSGLYPHQVCLEPVELAAKLNGMME